MEQKRNSLYQSNRIHQVPIERIIPNPRQPRRRFEEEPLRELAESIRQHGVLQPLSVQKTPSGYVLVAGERRLRAAGLAGLKTVPCILVQATGQESALLALVENLHRCDLHYLDEAAAIARLISTYAMSQEEAARRLGRSQSAVANKLRLLKLPQDVIDTLRGHRLTERHARSLLRLEGPDQQRLALEYILKHQLNVAKTEEYIDRLCGGRRVPRRAAPVYKIRDVRLFLNTVNRGLAVMKSAGVDAKCGREETDSEITLTIHIPK